MTIALVNAVYEKKVKNIKLLLEKGSDITTKVANNGNMTLFHLAVANHDFDSLSLLLEHVQSNEDPSKVLTYPPSFLLIYLLRIKVFDASGLKNDSNVTVLKAAVETRKVQSILLLLAHSCSIGGGKSVIDILQDYGAFAVLPDNLKVLSLLSLSSISSLLVHLKE